MLISDNGYFMVSARHLKLNRRETADAPRAH